MIRLQLKYYLFILIFLSHSFAFAQANTILTKCRVANDSKDISYDYKLFYRNMRTNRNVDSAKGHLYCKAGNYVDSSNFAFTARVSNYYCKLDHHQHTATIGDMYKYGKRRGIKFENNEHRLLYNISEAVIAKYGGTLTIDSSNRQFYRIITRLKNYPITYMQIDVRRDNYKALAAYLETDEYDNNNKLTYRRSYYLNNIKATMDDKTFDLTRIFTVANNKFVLNPAYSKYKLTPLAQ